MVRSVKAFLNPKGDVARGAPPEAGRYADQTKASKNAGRQLTSELRKRIRSKKREFKQIKGRLRTTKERAERLEFKKRKKRVQQEIFQLENQRRLTSEYRAKIKRRRRKLSRIRSDLGTAKKRAERIRHKKREESVRQEIVQLKDELNAASRRWAEDEPQTGALPDFVIIGAMKGGTSYLYHLLTQHPLVEPCAKKELHFFDLLFEQEGVEWYERCFPAPRRKNGRRTITGEATPYLAHHLVPERMAEVIPQARLIALLRNPVDRAYSHYQQGLRKGRETRTFKETISAAVAAVEAKRARPLGGEGEAFEQEHRADLDIPNHGYLSKGIYVDQLLRWSEFFAKEQMLILKSEDFFERPANTLKTVFDFLDLPDWEPEAPEVRHKQDQGKYKNNKLNKGTYKQGMDPAVRRHLEKYFEPHNRRLYDYLGVDFGW
jgi:hypothetical protein